MELKMNITYKVLKQNSWRHFSNKVQYFCSDTALLGVSVMMLCRQKLSSCSLTINLQKKPQYMYIFLVSFVLLCNINGCSIVIKQVQMLNVWTVYIFFLETQWVSIKWKEINPSKKFFSWSRYLRNYLKSYQSNMIINITWVGAVYAF